METLLNKSLKEMEEIMLQMGEKKFRALQIYEGLYLGKYLSNITNISQELKDKILMEYKSIPLTMIEEKVSSDGTIKFLFRLDDNQLIESVLMKYDYGYSVCLSTQVGCKMGCRFCATGRNGFVRHLSAGEILAQVICINAKLEGGLGEKRAIKNIVLMGQGEPLDNYENVKKFIQLAVDQKGLGFSHRNIALSTCGIVDKIYKLADDGLNVLLTVSLHNPFDEERMKIMPIAKVYSVKDIINACKYYEKKTNRRIMFEYTVIEGQNDGEEHANRLKKLLTGLNSIVNVIPLNVRGGDNARYRDIAYAFFKKLKQRGVNVSIRRSLGVDIEGACGQLKEKYIEDKKKSEE